MRQNEKAGLLYALAGYSSLSLGDAVIKSMVGMWPAPAMAALRYVIGAIGLAALLWRSEGAKAFVMADRKIHLLRGGSVALATVCFFAALTVMPLAAASALTFTSPMITALLAAAFLGEPARREIWLASIIAFIGVLIVLRPNLLAAGLAALLPLGAALGMSTLLICNRWVAGKASPLAMQFYISIMAVPFLIAAMLAFSATGKPGLVLSWPAGSVIARCALVALFASLAHWLIYNGTVRAGAASVAPMTYVQLLWAVFYGWSWFGTRPDPLTLLGGGIIIAAGLYLWSRGRANSPANSGPLQEPTDR